MHRERQCVFLSRRIHEPDTAGFPEKVKDDNPDLKFLHFGDIDAGGFYIHDHLCRMTGVPFGLWHMSAEELKDPRYAGCLQKLTPGDRKRLKNLQGDRTVP